MYKGLARLVSLTVHAYAGDIYQFSPEIADDARDRVIRNVTEYGCYTQLKSVPVSEQRTWFQRQWPTRGGNAP